MHLSLAPLPLLLALTTAHFTMHYPTSRNGETDDTEPQSPCGGYAVSAERTRVSFPSFPVALEMGHDETVIQMLLSLSSDPSSEAAFNVTLERTFSQTGLGDFCLPAVTLPDGVDVKDGDNATLQVVTDGEGGGGLYVCADITFTTTAPAPPSDTCKNGTGVTASALPVGDNINANDSTAAGQPQSGDGASASASASGGEAASSSSSAGVAAATAGMHAAVVAGWGVIGAGVVGGLALL